MSAVNMQFVKIQAFELCTPKFLGDLYDKDRYDHEQVEYLLKKIMNIPLGERAFHRNNKVINLVRFEDADDQEFMEGTFSSARYGQTEEIIDVHKQQKAADKPKDHGIKGEVHFVLDKRNGLLLVQKDKYGVVGRDMIHRFLGYHAEVAEDYREKFNTLNSATIPKRSYVQVAAIPSEEFFEEVEKFALIKEAFVIKEVEGESRTNNEGIEYLAKQAKDNNVEDFQEMRVTYRNTVKKGGIKHIKAFFQKLYEQDKFDNYGVSGTLESGKNRTITMAKIPQGYDVRVEFNDNGLPSMSGIINQMVTIAKYKNPILNKNDGMKPVQKVGELLEMEREEKSRQVEARQEDAGIS